VGEQASNVPACHRPSMLAAGSITAPWGPVWLHWQVMMCPKCTRTRSMPMMITFHLHLHPPVQVGEEEWGGQGGGRVLEEVDPAQGAHVRWQGG
jgi:hypothetical protein